VPNFETITYTIKNKVATITLNSPKTINALSRKMRKELLDAVLQANEDIDANIVVLNANGKGFCAGADLSENYKERYDSVDGELTEEYKPFIMAINDAPKLYISSIHGAAAGAGSSLAMACDFSIMASNAYIFQAFSAIALVPDCGASWHLVNRLGYKRAMEMVIQAEKMPAETCLSLGLVNRVVAPEELEHKTQEWAEQLAKGAPIAQRETKRIMQQAMRLSLSDTFDLESASQNIAIETNDAKEGVQAFFERRPAVFNGN